ncbi:MAG: zf-HC2 domain-containing protein [Clostridia bacterium]|nr:zf-HC2 domain-containing protein [Clostridia bacterium]
MEKTPSCKKFRLMADEYIEGELTAAEMREFEAHIAECEDCRKEFEELRALKEAIRSAEEEMPEELHSRIMASIESEPKKKPRRKAAFFRGAAISVACVMLCLSATLAITLIPMWRSGTGGEGLPNDLQCSLENSVVEECNTEMKTESALSKPTDENIEAEQTSASAQDPAPEVAPSDTIPIPENTFEESMSVAETAQPETMTPETMTPETDAEMQAPAEEATESATKDGAETQITYQDAAPEASSVPGGEEITLALLIVSGLLAVASFVAFLISLSSVRTSSDKKN